MSMESRLKKLQENNSNQSSYDKRLQALNIQPAATTNTTTNNMADLLPKPQETVAAAKQAVTNNGQQWDNHYRDKAAQAAGVGTFRTNYGYGNIDLTNRPIYNNANGTYSTVDSFSTNIDGKEVLLPTIGRDANGNAVRWTEQQAIDNYLKTGENLGIFNTVQEADAYAQWLHNQQEGYYGNVGKGTATPGTGGGRGTAPLTGWDYVGSKQREVGEALSNSPVGVVQRSLAGGVASGVRDVGNALGYVGQMQAQTAMMQADPYLRMWGQNEIADKNAGYVQQVRDEGYKPLGTVLERAGISGATQLDQGIRDFANAAATDAKNGGKVLNVVAQTANGVGGMVPSILSNVVAPGSGMWVLAAKAFGNATESAIDAGASNENAVLYGGAVAAVEVLTEMMFDGIPGLRANGENVLSVSKGIEKAVGKYIKNTAAQNAVMAVFNILGEGAEEFVAEFGDWGLNKLLVGNDNRTLSEVHKDAWYSAFLGALISFVMSTPSNILNIMSPQEIADGVMKTEEANRTYKPNYFDNMTPEEAKAEYIRLMKQYHPDTSNDVQAAQYSAEINDAYDRYTKKTGTEAKTEQTAATVQDEAAKQTASLPAAQQTAQGGNIYQQALDEATGNQQAAERTLPQYQPIPQPPVDAQRAQAGAEMAARAATPAEAPAAQNAEKTLAPQADSTAVNDAVSGHTPAEQQVIEDYKNSVDDGLVAYFNEHKTSQTGAPYYLSNVGDRAATDIQQITGQQVTPEFRTALDARQAWHINNDHGENGQSDHTMADPNDVGRMQYVLDNYDKAEYGGTTDAYWEPKENGKNRQAPVVVFSKKVNGTYYVVEAVPVTKAKTVNIVSAYMLGEGKTPPGRLSRNINGAVSQPPDANAPWFTAKTDSANAAPIDTTIAQPTADVKPVAQSNAMQYNGENTPKEVMTNGGGEEQVRGRSGDARQLRSGDHAGSGGEDQGNSAAARISSKDSDAGKLTLGRKVSLADFGVKDADATKTASLVTGGATKYTAKASANAKKNGRTIVFTSGEKLGLKNGNRIEGFSQRERNLIGVTATDERHTADQFAAHEEMEIRIGNGEFDVKKTTADVSAMVGPGVYDCITEVYRSMYPGKSDDDIAKEMLCDAAGFINRLSGTKFDALKPYEEIIEDAFSTIHDYFNSVTGNAFELADESTMDVLQSSPDAMGNAIVDALDADNIGIATEFSYASLANAAGFKAIEENGVRAFTRDGKPVKKVTPEDIKASPIGALIKYAADKGYLGNGKAANDENARKQIAFFAEVCTLAARNNDFAMSMQFAGAETFTAIKANSDTQYGTTYDYKSVCIKTQACIDQMSAAMVSKKGGLTKDEILGIYRDVNEIGLPVPCPECYVWNRWIGIGGLLDNIWKYQERYGAMTFEEVKAAYDAMHDRVAAKAEEAGLSFGKAKTKLSAKITKEYQKQLEKVETTINRGDRVSEADAEKLKVLESTMTDVKALTWIENVYFGGKTMSKDNVSTNYRVPAEILFDLNRGAEFATQYKDAWAFRTTQGAGYGKAITPYSEAGLGEGILGTNSISKTIKDKAAGKLNNPFLEADGELSADAKRKLDSAVRKQRIQLFRGGQRFNSTSDASNDVASDYLLSMLEMQSMHGGVQVYTKVDGSVQYLSNVGAFINQSLMPLGSGLDENGNLRDTTIGGMSPKAAFANRKKYENAGTITIGVNDDHIRALYKDDKRDFIIPYHVSGGDAAVVSESRAIQDPDAAEAARVRSSDYTRTQNEKVLSDVVLKSLGKDDAEIEDIKKNREARIAILTQGKPDMSVVRANPILSKLYDMFNGGKWDGVKLPKSEITSHIYPNEFWDTEADFANSGINTELYLQYCEDLGILHKFSGMVPRNGVLVGVPGYDSNGNRVQLTDLAYKYKDGEITEEIEPYYWKTLIDHRMYGNAGQPLEQGAINLSNLGADVVKDFAKKNSGRTYDQQKSAELAKQTAEKFAPGDEEIYDTEFSTVVTDEEMLKRLEAAEKQGIVAFKDIKPGDQKGVVKVYRAMQAQPVDADGNVIPNATLQRVVSYDPLVIEAKVFSGSGKKRTSEIITAPAKLFSPMAGQYKGVWRAPIELNKWEMSEGHPERATPRIDEATGKPKIDTDKKNASYGEVMYDYGLEKGGVDDSGKALGDVPARYNPYTHTSVSALNDQFSSANKRSELVTVEVLVPVWHINNGKDNERLPLAKDRVGPMSWHSGPTSSRLAKIGKPRTVILTRYDKPIRVVPDAEVAKSIAENIGDSKNVAIPRSVVTPSLGKELRALGVSVLDDVEWKEYNKKYPTEKFAKLSGNNGIETQFSTAPDIERLEEENERLKQRLAEARAETRLTRGWRADPNDVATVAKTIKESASSSYSQTTLESRITKLVEDASNGEISEDEVMATAGSIARDVVEKSSALASKDLTSYNAAKDYLKRVYIEVPDALRDHFDDFKSFTQTHKEMRMKTEGVPIADVYAELQRDLGKDYFPDMARAQDMLQQMGDVMNSLAPVYGNQYSFAMQMVIEEMSNEVLAAAMDIGQKITYADKAAAKLSEAKAENRATTEKLKTAESYIRSLQRIATRRAEQNEALKQHYADSQKRKREARDLRQSQDKLMRVLKRLNNRKLPMATKQEILDAQNAVAGVVDTVQKYFTGELKQKQWVEKGITDVGQLQEYIRRKTDPGYDPDAYDPNFSVDGATKRILERYKMTSVKDMTATQIKELTQALLNIEARIASEKKFVNSQLAMEFYQAGEEVMGDIASAKPGTIQRKLRPSSAILRMVDWNEDNPLFVAYKEMLYGEEEAYGYVIEALKPFKELLSDHKWLKTMSGKDAKAIKITGRNIDGNPVTVEITPMMRIDLYLNSLNDDNFRDLYESGGGGMIPDMTYYRKGDMTKAMSNAKRVFFTRPVLQNLINAMDDREKAYVKLLQQYYNHFAPDHMNPVSLALDGWEKFTTENYYPIARDSDFLTQDYEQMMYAADPSLAQPGWGEERTHSVGPIYIMDANARFMKMLQANSMYAHQAIPLHNMNRLLGVKLIGARDTVMKALDRQFPDQSAKNYLTKFMSDYAGHRGGRKNPVDKAMDKLRSNYTQGVLALSFNTAAIQFASYPTAAAVVSPAALLQALTPAKADTSFIDKYTTVFTKRTEGFSMLELAEARNEGKYTPKILNPIQAVDIGTTSLLKRAAYFEVRNTRKDLEPGTKAFEQAVVNVYSNIIWQTQPNYSTALRPEVLRSDSSMERAMIMLATQPLQQYNIMYDAIGRYESAIRHYKTDKTPQNKAKVKQAQKGVARAAGVLLASSLLLAILRLGVDVALGNYEKKYKAQDENDTDLAAFARQFGMNMVGGITGMWPIGKSGVEFLMAITDIISTGFGGRTIFGKKWYGYELSTISALSDATKDLVNAVYYVVRAANGKSETKTAVKKVITAAEDICLLLGIPAQRIHTYVKAIAHWAGVEEDELYDLIK